MIEKAKKYARHLMEKDSSGHDYYHALRVLHLAERIAAEESRFRHLDMELVQLIAILHDVDDRKLSPETCENLDRARDFLNENGVEEARIELIVTGIRQISFKGADSVSPDTIEAKCVQDADRLDAMGAIGIARTFAYGGSKGRRMHDPAGRDPLTSVNHFHEKLLNLAGLMNTDSAREIARERHRYMEEYLERFQREWDGNI